MAAFGVGIWLGVLFALPLALAFRHRASTLARLNDELREERDRYMRERNFARDERDELDEAVSRAYIRKGRSFVKLVDALPPMYERVL